MSSTTEQPKAIDEIEVDGFEGNLLLDEESSYKEEGEGVWLISYADLMTLLMGFFALMLSMATFEERTFDAIGEETAKYFGGTVDQPFAEIGTAIDKVIKEQGLEDRVKIEIKKTEIKVTFEGTLFFDSGSIDMNPEAENLMQKIIMILRKKARDEKFLIEGHTDDVPIHQGIIASNWELSALRASAVARIFEKFDFDRKQIMTIGYGETRPLEKYLDERNQPIPEGRKKNRRVVLKVMRTLPL